MYRFGKAELDSIIKTTKSGSWFRYYGSDRHTHAVEKFEKKVNAYTKSKYVLATSSCTGALISSLSAMGVGPQDEVLVPAYTFIASAASVIAVGAVPVIVEIDETLTMDVADIKRKISPRTKVILPVHMLGYPCNMNAIMAIARKHKIKVLEDTAQAVGAHYHGKALGTIGHMGCYSLQWHKIITSGEGGCLMTNDRKLFERAAIYHDDAHCFRGIDKGIPSFPGVNYRMSELAGAIGWAQVDRLKKLIGDLRKTKTAVVKKLGNLGKFRVAPSYDAKGEAGTNITLLAPDRKSAELFTQKTGKGSILSTKTTNWHIYYHWDYILEKRSASGTGFPWKVGNWVSPVKYSKDMCPKTLDILQRSFNYGIDPDSNSEKINEISKKIRQGIN